jgi:light-regulated signal transduction histidine kinase (bacteriophytochrome)
MKLCDDLEPMYRQLERDHRELRAFSYRAAHDLKTPLNAVRGFAYLLSTRYADGMRSEGQKLLQYIDRSAADMERLIDALLALSGVGSKRLRREPVDLSAMAHHVWRELEIHSPMAPDCASIEPDVHAEADPGLARSLLLNLLGNAKKYSVDRAQPRIGFEKVHTTRGEAFCVHDNGVGFAAPEAQSQLFLPFVRFHNDARYAGHGLGLAICMRIVRHHHGDIWLESRPGDGTRVYFTLGPTA